MTYDEAAGWLKSIGGTTLVAEEQKRGLGRITVIAENTKGHTVSRHTFFDDTLTGLERERIVRDAFTQACEALKLALDA